MKIRRFEIHNIMGWVLTFLLLAVSNAAHAHFDGARISIGKSSVSIEQPDDLEADQMLFSAAGGIKDFLERLSMAASQVASTHAVLYAGKENTIYKFVVSSRVLEANSASNDTTITVSTPQEFSEALCRATRLCNSPGPSRSAAAQTSNIRRPLMLAPAGKAGEIKLEMGEFPTTRKIIQLEHRRSSAPKQGAASPLAPSNVGALIERLSKERRASKEAERSETAAPPPGAAAAPIVTAPTILAVHCTAFQTSLPAAKTWVERLRGEKTRSKSHGVILTDGTYLPIWPFTERRVWATKTETCAETAGRAMGSIINVELHYYCGYKGPDKQIVNHATEEQYKTLAKITTELISTYGPLRIVSHKEIDRGLRDGHIDPLGFEFSQFSKKLSNETLSKIQMITDHRQAITSGSKWSHYWPPQFTGSPALETIRTDDCRRDHRP